MADEPELPPDPDDELDPVESSRRMWQEQKEQGQSGDQSVGHLLYLLGSMVEGFEQAYSQREMDVDSRWIVIAAHQLLMALSLKHGMDMRQMSDPFIVELDPEKAKEMFEKGKPDDPVSFLKELLSRAKEPEEKTDDPPASEGD